MRITNTMMTNSSLNNINTNKINMSKLEEQYSTQKKIQRPSDDPIIAVRALKLRSNLDELNQYYEKNIPDAKAWMDITESALKSINGIMTSIHTYCNQGATDTLTKQDRASIVENLEELKSQIYQEGDSNYAGRYVFTGYKTDTALLFEKDTALAYDITETFDESDLEIKSMVLGDKDIADYNTTTYTASEFSASSNLVDVYRVRLSYDKLSETVPPTITATGFTGSTISLLSTDPNAYKPGADDINYLADTGELILGKNVYNTLSNSSDLSIKYRKNSFSEGELRPEHYFNCTADPTGTDPTVYVNEDQQIQYEINFNQKLTVNTQAKDAIKHGTGQDVDEIQKAVLDVENTESKITEVKKLLEDGSNTEAQVYIYTKMKEQFETELALKNKVMQSSFEKCMGTMTGYQDTVNVAVADLGSRYVRLELTENRLSDQQVDFEDLLSTNEDADLAETLVRYNSQEQVYNASLSAAAKVVKNTLLDFL